MYTQFTKERRIELAALLRAGHSPRECAQQFGMNKSAVTRELQRNKRPDGAYRGAAAHALHLARRKAAKKASRKIENDTTLRAHLRKRIRKRDSPEQIAGRIKRKKSHALISHEAIYQWIFEKEPALKKHLRRIGHKGKYRRRRGTVVREKARDGAKVKRIDTRPAVVETRERLGDWEGDTIIGKEKTIRLVSGVERKSGYGLLSKLGIVSAPLMHETLRRRFCRVPLSKRKTFTYDNGSELGEEDTELEKKLCMEVYRAYPYHSWERASNENYNGLVRDFLPKGTLFATVSHREVKRIERNLNHRPRKRLGYLTPHEVFVLELSTGAVQG